MEITAFSELNKLFVQKLSDESPYVTDGKSFIKIMQHGLSYARIKDNNKLIKNYLSLPFEVQLGIMKIKSLLRKPIQQANFSSPILIIEPNRFIKDENGQYHSMYFERLAESLHDFGLTWITKKHDDGFPTKLSLNRLPHDYPTPDKIECDFLKLILKTLKKIKGCDTYTNFEKQHIQSAFHIYFDDFRFYYNLLKGSRVKCVLFICHYQTEGLIAALQALGIRAIEVQHGLIAENDLYYAYPNQFSNVVVNADFPDNILVYGSYWNSILSRGCEFKQKQIVVAGDYIWRKSAPDLNIKKKNTVLICAQKNMHVDYVRYAEKLSSVRAKHPDWQWILKLHPLEAYKSYYDPLRKLGFEIIDTERTLDNLLLECRIQISIFSTTFYDALGFDVVNFSLQNYGIHQDYAADMISECVALPLSFEDDPIERYKNIGDQANKLLKREEVYASFDEDSVRSLILSTLNQ
jgi:hypothetical protein